MSELIVFNGVGFVIPDPGDEDWGQNVTDFLVAIPTGCLQKTGGTFTLTADVNFGASFGLLSTYYKSRSSNVASAGVVRLANTDLVEWRNFANSGNNLLGVNASDQLIYNGTPLEFNSLADSHIFVGNASNVATDVPMTGDIGISNTGVTAIQSGVIVNADVNASAAIAYTKLNLTGSIVNADIYSSAAIAYSKLNLSNSIMNADVNTSAAIAFSKLASLTSAHILVGSAGNVATDVALSGDATLANTGALTLATVNGNVGSFTYSNITVNAKGLVTAASSGTLGNLTDAGTDGITVTGGTNAVIGAGTSLSQHVADSTHNGYLSSTDWSTFNGKQAAGNYITALTGDVTATGPGSVAATLATVNGNVGTFSYPTITVNAKGLITAASSNTPVTSITGTTNQIIASASTGAVTLSTPQDIATSSSPTFVSETLTSTTNQLVLGTTRTITISATQPATTSRTYTIPDQGAAANFLLDQANYTIAGTWTFSNSITLSNAKAIVFKELTGTGTDSVTVRAPDSVTTSYTLQWPPAVASAGQVLTDAAGNGVLSWSTPTGSGTVNTGTAGNVAYYATSTNAVSTTGAFTVGATGPNGIVAGTNTNNSAAAGFVGEYIESIASSTAFPTSTQFGDLTSITLSAGDWDVTGIVQASFVAGVITEWSMGISTTSGNSSAGLTTGSNALTSLVGPTAANNEPAVVPVWRVSLSGSTVHYLKYKASYNLTAPQAVGRLSARRVR